MLSFLKKEVKPWVDEYFQRVAMILKGLKYKVENLWMGQNVYEHPVRIWKLQVAADEEFSSAEILWKLPDMRIENK